MHLSPAFVSRYEGTMRMYTHVDARLEGADAQLQPTRAQRAAFGSADEVVPSAFADDGATRDGLSTIARALRIVAIVAAIAGAVVIALAASRLARTVFRDHVALRALGWTRRQFAMTSVVVFGPALLLGTVAGLGLGLLLAPRALVGLAGRVDPEPHRVLVNGGIVLVVGAGAALLGLVAAAVAGHRSQGREARRTRPVPRLLRLDRPVPLVLGVRRALVGESELGGRTSRGATVVLGLALAGAVAALVVSASIGRLQTDPSLYGGGDDGQQLDAGESIDKYEEALPRLDADPRVASLIGLHIGLHLRSGGVRMPLLAVDPVRGEVPASMVDGRLPRGNHEVALGPATLDDLGKHVGDRVVLHRGADRASYRIAGTILFPEGDFSYDEGVAMSVRGAARLVDDVAATSNVHQIEFAWAEGVNAARANRKLEAEGFTIFSSADAPALVPARVTNLGEVERVPRYLAAFLGVLALVTLGHALATSARRRARETATLRALGFTRRASAAVLMVQAATIVLVALLVGVPLGLLLGDRIWTVIADGANVVVLTVAPVLAVGLFVGAVAVLAAVATASPVWRTMRARPGEALRAE
jgi:predicted lysophospholipase L1 biosynthesis ABC-type transport system permease subunit